MLSMAEKVPAEERRRAFGSALNEALRAKEVTQRELATELGTTQSAVSAWVNGEAVPEPDVVFATERFLELSPGFLSRRLGYLPPEAADTEIWPSFEEVVMEDEFLDDTSKRGLLAAYKAFIDRRRGGGKSHR